MQADKYYFLLKMEYGPFDGAVWCHH